MNATKRKEKRVSQFDGTSDEEEIQAELQAMTSLEYNLHSDYERMMESEWSEIKGGEIPAAHLVVKKTRACTTENAAPRGERGGGGGGGATTTATAAENKQPSSSVVEKTSSRVYESNDNAIQAYVPQASTEELRCLIRRAATNCEERYKILDARDRLMRAKRLKTRGTSGGAGREGPTRGTCPDMCPEKERLMRECQRQAASYELLDGPEYAMNHAAAVKQYSRSSADQEEPLPHDLRPVGSLLTSMSYLLCEIADLCESESNLGEWYHFVWDRTRAIRKDIAQQELCCPESVRLVEQCARFHIVCAERLCAEEPSVFDKKINTENLTKCLQTLKYMYHDLRLRGIVCDNEPEFRAYVVLLNLNDANFMWDVARLPEKVQKSAEMRFAVKVYSALESNNYAKFFRLVGETSYLNACILLRYFNQVRAKALAVMVKAYCRTRSTSFPLYELIDILAFEDENEAVSFCERLGLGLSGGDEELRVVLDRRSFCLPRSGTIAQGRALNSVESKRRLAGRSIGLCIAGQRMPEKLYKEHRPHNSFDSQGYLKPESIDAEDQIADGVLDNAEQSDNHAGACGGVGGPNDDEDDEDDDDDDADDDNDDDEYRTDSAEPVSSFEICEEIDATMSKSDSAPTLAVPTPVGVFGKIHDSSRDHSDDKRSETFGSFAEASGKSDAAATIAPLFSFSAAASAAATANATANPTATSPFFDRSRSEDRSSTFESASGGIFGGTPRVPNIFAKSRDKTFETRKTSIHGGKASNVLFGKGASLKDKTEERNDPRSTTSESGLEEDPKWNGEGRRSEWDHAPQQQQQRQQQQHQQLRVQRIDLEERIGREADEAYARLEKEIIDDVCEMMVREEKNRLAEDSSDMIFGEILAECVRQECEDALDREIGRSRKLDELTRRTINRIVIKYYGIWRESTRRKRLERDALESTPVWLQRTSLEQCARSLYRKEQRYAIENIKRKRFKVEDCYERMGEGGEDVARRVHRPSLIESNIYEGIRENARILELNLPSIVHWKMVVSWPAKRKDRGFSGGGDNETLERWRKTVDEYLCPTPGDRARSYRANEETLLRVCIVNSDIADEKARDDDQARILGSDAILFVVNARENPESLAQRFTATISLRRKLMPVPVVALVVTTDQRRQRLLPHDRTDGGGVLDVLDDDKLERQLDRLVRSGYVSEYLVRHCALNFHESFVVREIGEAVTWLAVNKSPPVPLEMDYSRKIFDTCLTEELWLRILGDSSFNEHLRNALRDVNFVIELHNEAVAHLTDVLLDPESLAYTDFPPEFRDSLRTGSASPKFPCTYEHFDSAWRERERRARFERDTKKLLLPEWRFDWPIGDPIRLEKCLVRYCERVSFDNVAFEPDRATPPTAVIFGQTNFIEILLEIVKEKIGNLEPGTTVVYNKNHVKHFRNSPWWFKSSTLANYHRKEEERRAVAAAADSLASSDLLVHRNRSSASSPSSRTSERDINMEIEETIERYESSILDPTNARRSLPFDRDGKRRLSELLGAAEKFEENLAEQMYRTRLLDDKLSLVLATSAEAEH